MASLLRQVGLTAICGAVALVAFASSAAAQVAANQPIGVTVADESAASQAALPAANIAYEKLQGQEIARRGGASAESGLAGQRSSSIWVLWLQTALVLGIVLAGMWLTLKWLRKRGIGVSMGGADSPVQVLHRGYLTGRHQVVLVRFGGRVLLLGVSPQGVSVLSEMANPEEAALVLARLEGAKSSSASNDFQQAMREATQDYPPGESGSGGPVIQTPSREQIGAIRGEIRNLLAKMQSLGKKPQK